MLLAATVWRAMVSAAGKTAANGEPEGNSTNLDTMREVAREPFAVGGRA